MERSRVYLNNNFLKSKQELLSLEVGFSNLSLGSEYSSNSLSEKLRKYEVVQENGQRRYGGPPKDWIGPLPPKGTEVFVNRLPRDCMEDELIPVFETVGKLYCLRLMMDFSGTNRGFCFVQYTKPEDAQMAICKFHGYDIRPGKTITVTKSVDNCRLFIGHIPKDLDEETIKAAISRYTTGVSHIILYLSSTDKKLNRGFCFVEYEDHRSAAMARRHLISTGIPEWNMDVMIDWATPEEEVDPHIMEKVSIMYMRNLLLKTSEKIIMEALTKYISPEDIKRVRKVKDFAFVHFSNREVARCAIETFNGFNLDGAKVEACWAKPQKRKFDTPTRFSPTLMTDSTDNEITTYVPPMNWMMPADANTWMPPNANSWMPPDANSWMPPSPPPSTQDVSPIVCAEMDRRLFLPGFENKPALINLACELLANHRAHIALQNLAIIMNWGDLVYWIFERSINDWYTVQKNQPLLICPHVRCFPAHIDPDEAKDTIAKLFLVLYIYS